MIRRRPPTSAQRWRQALGVLIAMAVIMVAVRGLGPLGAGGADSTGKGHGRGPAPVISRAPGPPAPGPRARRSPPQPAITRVFRATGGPVTAVVTERGAPVCEVDLLGPTGAVLAQGWAGEQPVTLHVVAVANAPVSLVLRPSGGTTLAWQADLTGAGSG
ncbi:MAG: hypothetical protein ACR2MN_15030 [Acidimicrobiales bacterium]